LGNSWASADSGLPNNGIVQLSASGSCIIAKTSVGFFLSTNSGSNWTILGTAGFPVSYAAPNAFVPVGRNIFYGFLDWGIYRSTNDGNSWAVSNTGLEGASITSLEATRKTVFASTFDYLYSISSGRVDWIPELVGQRVLTVMDTVLYATADSGICYSTDEGRSWVIPLNAGAPTGFQYTALAVGGTNIYLGGAGICGLCDQGGVYLSTNHGDSWSKKGLVNITSLFAYGTNVYAEIFNAIIYVSTDSGATWNTSSAPSASSFAARDSEMFVGTSAGVFHSFNKAA